MARTLVKVASDADWEVLKKYLGTGETAVVIFREAVAKEEGIIGGVHMEYDFCGKADILIDVVVDTDHMAIDAYNEAYPEQKLK